MKKIYTLLFYAIVFLPTNTMSQTVISTCTTDSVKLIAYNHQFGTLEWEISYDNKNWTKIPNAQDSIYQFKPSVSAYYRVVNKFSNCDPNYSSVTLVNTKPFANVGKDRIATDTFTFVSGNILAGATASWSILNGIGGLFEHPNNSYSKFTGFPAGTSGSNGNYRLLYTLQNSCGISTDTLNVKFVTNQFYNKLVVVDDSDTILSTQSQLTNGDFIIKFATPVPVIDTQTILIGITGDGFMRKVTSVSQNGSTFSLTTTQAKLEEVLENGGLEVGQLYNIPPINDTIAGRITQFHKLANKPTRAQLLADKNLRTGTHYFIVDKKIETLLKGVTVQEGNAISDKAMFALRPTENNNGFINFNFDNTTLYNQNGLTAKLDGDLTFTPNIVADIETSFLSLDKLNIGLNNAILDFHSKLTVSGNFAYSTPDYPFELATIHNDLIVVIGGVPMYIQLKTKLNGIINASTSGNVTFTNEYQKTYKVNAGLSYTDGLWDKYFSEETTSSYSNNVTASAQVTASLEVGPDMYFTINGLAGPYVFTKMTSDISACASTQNLQNLNWGVNFDLGAKLTVGVHAYMFKKKLFDKSETWENRKLYNEKIPDLMEYISGNNQKYTANQPLSVPLKVRVLSKQGYYIPNAFVTFEVLDNSGSVSQTEVPTDNNGFAQTIFTPTGSNTSKVQAYVKDCEFNYIQYAPIVFTATENNTGVNCTNTTLSASFYKQGNTLTLLGHLGALPYTYSSDFNSFTSFPPVITIVPGQNYHAVVKDANGCLAFAHFYQTTNNCSNTNLVLHLNVSGTNVVPYAKGGEPPYTYALDNSTTFTTIAAFTNLPTGVHTITVKDANSCTKSTSVNITNSVSNLVAYFEVPEIIYAGESFVFNNLSTNATSYSWNFGNGVVSNASNPANIYSQSGEYLVTLTASDGNSQSIFSKKIKVIENPNISTEGLVAYYPFNGNANDESGNGNNCIVNGVTGTLDRYGIPNRAFYFNGSSYLDGGNSVPLSLSLTNAVTVSAWIKVDAVTDGGRIVRVGCNCSDGTGYDFYTLPYGQGYQLACIFGNAYIQSNNELSFGKWYHVVFTGNTNGLKISVNGHSVASGPSWQVIPPSINSYTGFPFYIGQKEGNGFQNGTMDDIRIYNRALSEVEISQMFDTESKNIIPENGLVAFYPFNGNANDESGNNLNGTVKNTPTFATGISGQSIELTGRCDYGWCEGESGDHVILPAIDLNNMSAFSINIWVKEKSLLWQDGEAYISFGNDQGNIIQIGHYESNLHFSSSTSSLIKVPFNSSNIDAFQMYTLVYENGMLKAYQNGNVIGSLANATKSYSANTAAIARHWGISTYTRFNGSIDQVRIYSRALSDAEIGTLFTSKQ